jgi:hypothetical protein
MRQVCDIWEVSCGPLLKSSPRVMLFKCCAHIKQLCTISWHKLTNHLLFFFFTVHTYKETKKKMCITTRCPKGSFTFRPIRLIICLVVPKYFLLT